MKTYSIAPKPYAVFGNSQENTPTVDHLCELIDNAFDKSRGNASTVTITYNKESHTLDVLDDGVGIDHPGRLFTEGDTSGNRPGDIGMYGKGGTKALHQMSNVATVYSLRSKHICIATVDFVALAKSAEYPEVSDEFVLSTKANTPQTLADGKSGTLIRLRLRKQRTIKLASYAEALSSIYAAGLEADKNIILRTVGDKTIILKPEHQPLVDEVLISDSITHDDEVLTFTGRVGLLPDGKRSRPNVAVSYGIKQIFNGADAITGSEFSGAGMRGRITLGNEWVQYLSTSKTSIADDELLFALGTRMRELLGGLLQKSEDEKTRILLERLATGPLSNIFPKDAGDAPKVPAVKEKRSAKTETGETHTSTRTAPKRVNVKAPTVRSISPRLENDDFFKGAMVKVTVGPDALGVMLNRDNAFVLSAFEDSNQATVSYIILMEVTGMLFTREGNEKLMPVLFNQAERNEILASQDARQVATAILLKRVRKP